MKVKARRVIASYLALSFIWSPFISVRAQELPAAVAPAQSVEAGGAASSASTNNAEAPSETQDTSVLGDFFSENLVAPTSLPESADSSTKEKTKDDAPAEDKEKSKTLPPPGEESAAAITGSGSASGGADGSPNTIKQVVPEIDKTTGALTYTYPLKVPPGRKGMEPSLALTYNSLSSDSGSMFGYGWSLNIPYIRRINKNGVEKLFSENTFESSLSGELVSVPSTSQYTAKTETGEFLKYTFSSNVWTATDKAGRTYTFGNSSSTRQYDSENQSRIFSWALTEVRDLNDNYVTYTYDQLSGRLYPATISYTHHSGTSAPFEISFARQAIPRPLLKFDTGYAASTTHRISEIQIDYNGSWIRKYALSYATSSTEVRFLLDTITETGRTETGTTTALPAVDFDYQSVATTTGFISQTQDGDNISCPSSMDSRQGVIITDVNADGFSDLIVSYDSSSSSQASYLHTGTYNGDATWNASSTFYPPEWFVASTTFRDLGVRLADINGDGRPDIVKARDGATRKVYLNSPTGWSLYTGSGWQIPADFTANDNQDYGLRLLDINGDGLPDFVKTEANPAPTIAVWINTGSDWVSSAGWDASGILFSDGVVFGDINEDGLIDLIHADNEDATHWAREVLVNNGNKSWIEDARYYPGNLEIHRTGADWGAREMDVNGDGFSDIVQEKGGYSDINLRNIGSGWTTSTTGQWIIGVDFIDDSANDTGLRIGDYNGDGMPDVLDCNGGTDTFKFNAGRKPDLLTRIKLATGGAVQVQYKPSSWFKNGSTLLNPNLPFIISAVENILRGDGISPTSTQWFSYKGGSYYFGGPFDRKMAGFAEVVSTNAASATTRVFFHQGNGTNTAQGEYGDMGPKVGKIYRSENADSAGNIFSISLSKWDATTSSLSSTSTFVYASQVLDLTYDGDSDHKDKAESYTYSSTTGDITQLVQWGEVSGSGDGSFTDTGSDKQTTAFTYASDTPNYVFLPSIKTTTDNGGSKVRESKYYYDGLALGLVDEGNLTKEERWRTSTSYVDIEKTYNTYGLVTQEKDPLDNATTFTYDTWNFYPSTSTNALSQATGFTYDYSSGQVSQRKDANGLALETVFDGVDRVITEKQPSFTTTSTLVVKKSTIYTDAYLASVISSTSHLNSGSSTTSYTYLDGFGRPLQTKSQTENSALFAAADTAYNALERVQKESLPYFSTSASSTAATTTSALYTEYTYDALLRIASTTNAVGSVSRAYDDWKTIITDARGKNKALYSDAFGNLARVDEYNSGSTYTTTYSYDANNNLAGITDALGNVRAFTYDGLGRRLSAQDLHGSGDSTFGTWEYTYDDAGNLTQVTDPKSQTIAHTYDSLGRVLTENYTGAAGTEVVYTYDNCVSGIGKLCRVGQSSATSTYSYSAIGSISREIKNVSSTEYQTDYAYDRQGNPLTITNPDGSEFQYTYNNGGRVESIKWKESGGSYEDVVLDFDYGPHGKTTYQENANCTATTSTYDPARLYRLTNLTTVLICTPSESLMESVMSSREQASIGITPENVEKKRKLELPAASEAKKVKPTSTKEAASSTSSFLSATRQVVATTGGMIKNGLRKVGAYLAEQLIPVAAAEELYENALYNDANLVAYWRLEGNSSSTVGSYNGTDTSVNYASSSGKYGQGAAFTIANNSRITTSGMGTISTFSVSMWAQLTTDYSGQQQDGGIWGNNDGWNGTGQPYAYLRSSVNNPNTSGASWLLLNEYGDDPDNAGTGAAYAQSDFNDNQWRHVVITYDNASKTEKYYIDGSLARTNVFTSRPSTTFNSFTIGSSKFGSNWRTHAGNIDDVAVFSRVLTASEVSDLYSGGSSATIQDLTYTYDANGNITKIVDASGTDTSKTVDYSYDDLNRLTTASSSLATVGTNYLHSYTYDAVGNISSSTPAGAYSYGGSTYANPHAATTIGGVSYSYDTNGNLTSDSTWSHSWDYRNRLIQSTKTGATSTYAYDASNVRVKLVTASTTTVIPFPSYSLENGTPVKYLSVGNQLIASIRGSTSTADLSFIHTDHLGSAEKRTDILGEVVEVSDYYPYGSQRQNSYSVNDRKGFLGKDYDDITGLSQLEARYYKSDIGRFISQDPMFWALPIEYLIDPQQQNSYSYARNNPITFSDPTGNSTLIQSFVSAVQSFLNGIASFFGVSNSNFGSQSQTQAQAPKPSVNQANITKPTPTPAPRTTTWDPVTDQRIKQLDPRVQQPATNFVNNTESQAGVQLRVTTGYRSVEEQNRLYNQGRTTPGNVVTNARGGQSYHNYGRAIDVVIMEDGQPNWQKRIDDNVANIGIQQGFNWGGNWSGGFQDYPHFEMPLGQTIRDLMR